MHDIATTLNFISFDDRWFAKHCRISNVKSFLELLEVLLCPAALEVSLFSVKLPDMSSVR